MGDGGGHVGVDEDAGGGGAKLVRCGYEHTRFYIFSFACAPSDFLAFLCSCAYVAGAGLGGGSGNAATTLWAANELLGRPATTAQLLEWSGEIGSDISVFFRLVGHLCALDKLASYIDTRL